jgi:hypothetical protein
MEFMTIEEMRAMTRLKVGAAIARWFQAQGITYKMGVDGYPVVLKSHVEQVMSGIAPTSRAARPKTKPDFEALQRRLKRNGKEANGRHGAT